MSDQHNRREFLTIGALGLTGLAFAEQKDPTKDGPVKVKWIKITEEEIMINMQPVTAKRVFFEGVPDSGPSLFRWFELTPGTPVTWVTSLTESMASPNGTPVKVTFMPHTGPTINYKYSDIYNMMAINSLPHDHTNCKNIARK